MSSAEPIPCTRLARGAITLPMCHSSALLLFLALLLGACSDKPTAPSVADPSSLKKIRSAPELAPAAVLPAPSGPVRPVLQDAREPQLLAGSQDGALLLYLEAPESQELLIWDIRAEAVRARAALGGFKLRSAASTAQHWQLLSEEGMIATLPLLGGTLAPPLPAPCPGARFFQEGGQAPLLVSTACVAREVSGSWQQKALPVAYEAVAASTQADRVTVLGRTRDGRLELAVWNSGNVGGVAGVEDERMTLDVQATAGVLRVVTGPGGRIFAVAQGAGLLEILLEEPGATEKLEPTAAAGNGAPPAAPTRVATPGGGEPHGPSGVPESTPTARALKVRVLPLEPAVQDAWPVPGQDVLWTLEGSHLVRRTMAGVEQERAFWGPEAEARKSMRILQLLPTQGQMVLGEQAEQEGRAKPAALISYEPWQQLRLLQPLSRLHPCGMAWLPQAGLAALVLLEPGKDVLTTRLVLVGGSGASPVELLKVGLDPLPKDTPVPTTCQVIVSQDERILGIAAGSSIKLYDRIAKERAGHARPGPVVGMAFSPDGGSLVYGLSGGELFRAEVPALDDPVPLTRYVGGIEALVSAVDSDALAVVARQEDGSRRLELFAAERRQVLGGARLDAPVAALSWAAGAMRVAVATQDGRARWWTPPGPRFAPLPILPTRHLRVSPDARFIAGASAQVFRWKAGGGLSKAPLPARTVQLDAVASGGCIAVLDEADRLLVYAAEGGELRATLEFLALKENRWTMRLGGESSGVPETLRAVEIGGEGRVVAGNFALDGSIPVSLKRHCPG